MERETHVVLLPSPAFGHMIPFFQLSLALAKSGIHVHYISTPRNISRLPTPPNSISELIHFVSIPMPILETCPLPSGVEATVDLTDPAVMFPQFFAAYDLLEQPVKDFVASLSPNWLIIDYFPYWAVQMGRDLSVPVLSFSAYSAASMLFFGPPDYLTGEGPENPRSTAESLMVPPPWVNFPSSVAYQPSEAPHILEYFCGGRRKPKKVAKGGDKSLAERISKSLEGCEAVAIRSCYELEGEYLRTLAKAIGKPIIPTGLLVPELQKATHFNDPKWTDNFNWLTNQKEKSVIFVGFGSECRLTPEQINEIARGLELSKLPFFWVLRKPDWARDTDTELFPRNFLKNTSERGRICIGWAPQMEILGHPSIGASLFHSGWGSLIETIQFGHRLVVLPMIFDQCLNARLLVEKGLAFEVERCEDGSFTGEGIAKALIEAVPGSVQGQNLRKTATITSDQKLQQDYMDKFVLFLKTGIMKKI